MVDKYELSSAMLEDVLNLVGFQAGIDGAAYGSRGEGALVSIWRLMSRIANCDMSKGKGYLR